MAWRLRLVPEKTSIDFFRLQWITFGTSLVAMAASLILVFTIGLNFGIDFRGGTTIRLSPSCPFVPGSRPASESASTVWRSTPVLIAPIATGPPDAGVAFTVMGRDLARVR